MYTRFNLAGKLCKYVTLRVLFPHTAHPALLCFTALNSFVYELLKVEGEKNVPFSNYLARLHFIHSSLRVSLSEI